MPIYVAPTNHRVDSELGRTLRKVSPRYVAAVARRCANRGFPVWQNEYNAAVEIGYAHNNPYWSLAYIPDENSQKVYDFRAGDTVGIIAQEGVFTVRYVTASMLGTTAGIVVPIELVAHVVE